MKKEEIESLEIGGEKEQKFLTPKEVEIIGYDVEMKQELPCLYLEVKHPDSENTIKISNIKLKKFGKLKVQGLWLSMDDDGKLPYHSGVATLLRTIGVPTIKDLVGKSVSTDIVNQENPLLTFKGY